MLQDNELVSVHRRPDPERMPPFQKNYGLWIFASGKDGSSRPDSYYRTPRRYFEFYCLSQMYSGAGRLYVSDAGETDIEPGDCVIITPGTVHCYGGRNGEPYREDTVNFVGPIADMLMRSGILRTGLIHAGPMRRLLPIIEAAQDPSPDSQLRANIELQQLIVNFHLEMRSEGGDRRPPGPLVDGGGDGGILQSFLRTSAPSFPEIHRRDAEAVS